MGITALFLAAASWFLTGNNGLSQVKSRHMKTTPRLILAALCAVSPLIGLPVALIYNRRTAKPPKGMDYELWSATENSKYLKDSIAKQERKIEDLRSRGISGRRLDNEIFKLEGFRQNLQDNYLAMGAAERRTEKKVQPNLSFIHVTMTPDGRMTFGLPYDMDRNRMNEVRMAISKEYGINANNIDVIRVSDKRQSDLDYFGNDKNILVYDSKNRSLSEYGTKLSDEYLEKINDVDKAFEKALGQDYGPVSNVITIAPMGNTGVALNYNGMVLAYAVAGPDGSVRTTGQDIPTGTNEQLRSNREAIQLSASMSTVLRNCTDINMWIDKASKYVLSNSNVETARKNISEFHKVDERKQEKEELKESILNAETKSVKVENGLITI